MSSDPTAKEQLLTLLNRKRKAISLATHDDSTLNSTQRHKPAKKKKWRVNQEG